MTYSSGSLIQATDYNNLAWGGTQGTYTTGTKNIAYVMGVGNANVGYGQDVSLINTVSANATVTATQWSGLFYMLNRALGHQSGAGAQIASGNLNATAGSTITAFANVSTAVTNINVFSNVAKFSAQGSTTTGTTLWTSITGTQGALAAGVFTRTVTFANADQARYFFNAGGQINWTITASNINGTGRSGDIVTLFQTNLGGGNIRYATSDGRTGTGGTAQSGDDDQTKGYWNMTTAPALLSNVFSTVASYTTDYANVRVRTNGKQGSNFDNGTIVYLDFGWVSQSKPFNGALSANVGVRIDVVAPETTYLTSVVTTPTIG
jgi:hypothetical protein